MITRFFTFDVCERGLMTKTDARERTGEAGGERGDRTRKTKPELIIYAEPS